MNVSITELEDLINQVNILHNNIKNNNEVVINDINNYINDDNYTSKAFIANKNKMNEKIKPLLVQYEKLLCTFLRELNSMKQYYNDNVDIINLNLEELESILNQVKTLKKQEKLKVTWLKKLFTQKARSYQLDLKSIQSYESCVEIENILTQKINKLREFEEFDFLKETKNQINNLNQLVKIIKNDMFNDSYLTKLSYLDNIESYTVSKQTLPKIEDYKNYDDYLKAVGEYALYIGKATKIEIDGVTYYEFIDPINHDYYGNSQPNTKITIACLPNGSSYTYYKYGNPSVIGIPNGLIYARDKNGNYIKDESGKYVNFFDLMLSGNDINQYDAITVTSRFNSDIYNSLSEEDKVKCDNISSKLSTVEESNDFSVAIMKKEIVEEKGIEYKDKITLTDIDNQASKYVPNNQDLCYFASEVQFHADGAQKNMSQKATKIYNLYYLKNDKINNRDEQEIQNNWNQACSNSDMGRIQASGKYGGSLSTNNLLSIDDIVMRGQYIDDQYEYYNEKSRNEQVK